MEPMTLLFCLLGLGVLVWLVVLLIFCFAKVEHEEIKVILGMILIWGGIAILIGTFSLGEKLLK